MNYYVQIDDESPIFKGTFTECVIYRDKYCAEGVIVREDQLYIENN